MITKMEEVKKIYVDTISQGLVECEFIMGLYDACQTLIKYEDKYKIVDNTNIISKEMYEQIKEREYKIELNYFKEFIKSRRIDKDMILRFIKDLTSQE